MDPPAQIPHPDPPPEPLLRQLLADRDVDCPVCRYNLRGLRSDHCPECGAHLDLRVGSIDLKLGPWLGLLLSVGLPFGFFAIFLLIILAFNLAGRMTTPAEIVWLFLLGTAVFGAALGAVVHRRRVMWRKSPARQRRFAAWASLLSWLAALLLIWAIFAVD